VSYVLDLFLLKEALVVDPVMISTSGDILAGPSVLAGFRYDFWNLNYAASVWHKSIFRLFLQSSLFEILWLCNLMHRFFYMVSVHWFYCFTQKNITLLFSSLFVQHWIDG
jgi:hypothetical protein